MVLESTIVCVDNSEYMRNGDYVPTRLHAQNDAVNLICSAKTRANPENNVGLVTFNNGRVIVTLTTEVGKILANLHQVQPQGMINFETGIRVAHLALKHRQGRNHKMRIVAFIGSPVAEDEKESIYHKTAVVLHHSPLIRIAKKLKKEKVNVDLVLFGQEEDSHDKMSQFINTLNGKDGSGSHLVSIPPGPQLTDALRNSAVIQGEDGAGGVNIGAPGFEFGMDPNDDPELALALRVSMEEQRARQESEVRPAAAGPSEVPAGSGEGSQPSAAPAPSIFANVAQEAPVTSAQPAAAAPEVNFNSMTEEEQLAYAMQMSLNELSEQNDVEMDTDENTTGKKQ